MRASTVQANVLSMLCSLAGTTAIAARAVTLVLGWKTVIQCSDGAVIRLSDPECVKMCLVPNGKLPLLRNALMSLKS